MTFWIQVKLWYCQQLYITELLSYIHCVPHTRFISCLIPCDIHWPQWVKNKKVRTSSYSSLFTFHSLAVNHFYFQNFLRFSLSHPNPPSSLMVKHKLIYCTVHFKRQVSDSSIEKSEVTTFIVGLIAGNEPWFSSRYMYVFKQKKMLTEYVYCIHGRKTSGKSYFTFNLDFNCVCVLNHTAEKIVQIHIRGEIKQLPESVNNLGGGQFKRLHDKILIK